MIDMKSGVFTSLSGEWETPQELYVMLSKDFHFNLDPAATPENKKASGCLSDGLKEPWYGRVFLNPPYGREIVKWVKRCGYQKKNVEFIVALLPSRTDTGWWHECIMRADRIYFIRGRLKFSGHKTGAPFPSAIIIWKGGHYIPEDNFEKWM